MPEARGSALEAGGGCIRNEGGGGAGCRLASAEGSGVGSGPRSDSPVAGLGLRGAALRSGNGVRDGVGGIATPARAAAALMLCARLRCGGAEEAAEAAAVGVELPELDVASAVSAARQRTPLRVVTASFLRRPAAAEATATRGEIVLCAQKSSQASESFLAAGTVSCALQQASAGKSPDEEARPGSCRLRSISAPPFAAAAALSGHAGLAAAGTLITESSFVRGLRL